MGDLYASAIATTVLQLRAIPPRPSSYDSTVCLYGLSTTVEAAQVEDTLSRFGTIDMCELAGAGRAIVRFVTRAAAEGALAEGAVEGIYTAIEFQYNERPYADRGYIARSSMPHTRCEALWLCVSAACARRVPRSHAAGVRAP
jgi:hypothetical protein